MARIEDSLRRQEYMARGLDGYFTGRVLTDQQANSLKKALYDQNTPIEDRTTYLAAFLAETGPDYAVRALDEAKVDSGAILAAKYMLDNHGEDAGFARTIMAAALSPDKDLPKSEKTAGDLANLVNGNDYVRHMVALSNAFPFNQKIAGQTRDVQDIAYKVARFGPKTLEKLSSPYAFVNGDNNMFLRIPRQSGLDLGAVEGGLGKVRENIAQYLPNVSEREQETVRDLGVWRSAGGEAELSVEGQVIFRLSLQDAVRIDAERSDTLRRDFVENWYGG